MFRNKICFFCLIVFVGFVIGFIWKSGKVVKKRELQLRNNFRYTFISKDDIKVYPAKWRKDNRGGYLEVNKNQKGNRNAKNIKG